MGESEADKDRMLMEIERECLEVYRRKVDEASNAKARLHQSVASKEAELAILMAALGELNLHSRIQTDKRSISLKDQLSSITPLLEDLRTEKDERMKQFTEIKAQIQKINGEISEYSHLNGAAIDLVDLGEQDLSLRRLNEYQAHLRDLQKEKSDRLHKVLDYVNEVHSLCRVLGLDFGKTVSEVHPSLHETGPEKSTNISNHTLEGLDKAILKLKQERQTRIQKLKDIMASLSELWNLMDSPEEERRQFRTVMFSLGSSEAQVTESGVLSLEIIEQAAAEVERLAKLKASRMKELVIKRRLELEEICRRAHIEPDTSTALEKSAALIDSGLVDPSELLANIEAQITKAKDEAGNRREIMERIDRWLAACDEERWLEDYNQDDNRYSAGRGAHINLKRAERARVTVNKIPAMVDNLINRTLAWENERKLLFLYDGVRLVSMLEEYKISRQQKEEEKRRYRDQKKLQDLLLTEKESIYGSKPSPRRTNSFRHTNGYRANGNGSMPATPRRLSVGSATPELLTPRSRSGRQNGHFKEMRRMSTVPLNFVTISKEDTMSYASICGSEPGSPPQG
ncbi:Microtubule-associated protein [Macleaya cordata]|uniref:Microtubule-associated protein n=1 Tax=Macleaya cordata TaxID=56857 RepID=A0A200Q8K1_MACCD|nr:Microtubule-associated protein [Macleaya cordata]